MSDILGRNETARCENENKVAMANSERREGKVQIPTIYMRCIRMREEMARRSRDSVRGKAIS